MVFSNLDGKGSYGNYGGEEADDDDDGHDNMVMTEWW